MTFGKKELLQLLAENDFEVLQYRKFMISPVGVPLEEQVEGVLRRLGVNGLMANQIIVARK